MLLAPVPGGLSWVGVGDAISSEAALCWQLCSEPALQVLLLPKMQQGERGKAQASSRPHRELVAEPRVCIPSAPGKGKG